MNFTIIQDKIFDVRAQRVMLDYDLAQLYEVETRILNQAVKRNSYRFPEDFMFQLTAKKWAILKSQFVISKENSDPPQDLVSRDTETLISQIVTSKKETRGGTQKIPFTLKLQIHF